MFSIISFKTKWVLAIILFSTMISAQRVIDGKVTDKAEVPIIGANIFIKGSYDGTVSDEAGNFQFNTDLSGSQILLVSYLGYESKTIEFIVEDYSKQYFKLRESASTLDAVEISASTFTTGDNSKLAVLTPLEVVTTAGSMGDVIAAMQTLPGTQTNADDGRLFVRGGDAREAQIFIDGLRVFTPYTRGFQGTPQRGRYSPFLFKGISFSTGGYDAAFGQALSGVLDMSTTDDPRQSETNISLMTIGLGLGHTKKWDKSSISFSGSYIDFTPYYKLASTRLTLTKPFRAFSAEMVHRQYIKGGLLKNYIAGDSGNFGVNFFNLDEAKNQDVDITNGNLYINSTYRNFVTEKTSYKLGFSYGYNRDKTDIDTFRIREYLTGYHAKVSLKTVINDFVIINYGADLINQKDRVVRELIDQQNILENEFSRSIIGSFVSMDYYFSKYLALKLGLRSEYHDFIEQYEIDPRITFAYKLGENSQVSLAYGQFNQELNPAYLAQNSELINERASHYLINYNLKNEKTILRLEGYYKDYNDLITYKNQEDFNAAMNEGYGRAYGIDLFYRANGIIKNVDMWMSYSWLNNERKYEDYPVAATPNFSTDHNFSLVTKKWFSDLKSQLGVTYSLTSGRPYDDPHTPDFMIERSKPYHNISLSWAYLISQQKILFASISNAPGFKNQYGYRYSSMPDENGNFASQAIQPNEDRFFFIGFFITMSEDRMKNQLDSL